MANLEPNEDRILVRPWKEEEINGVVMPEARKKEAISTGQVIAVGPGRRHNGGDLVPMKTVVGDTILYDSRSGLELRHDNKRLLFLHDSQVVAFVRVTESKEEPDDWTEADAILAARAAGVKE